MNDGVALERMRMIDAMCLTLRHDFGLDKPEGCLLSSGMTDTEREGLRNKMTKLFDHHFAPALSAVTCERDRLSSELKALRAERVGKVLVPAEPTSEVDVGHGDILSGA